MSAWAVIADRPILGHWISFLKRNPFYQATNSFVTMAEDFFSERLYSTKR